MSGKVLFNSLCTINKKKKSNILVYNYIIFIIYCSYDLCERNENNIYKLHILCMPINIIFFNFYKFDSVIYLYLYQIIRAIFATLVYIIVLKENQHRLLPTFIQHFT